MQTLVTFGLVVASSVVAWKPIARPVHSEAPGAVDPALVGTWKLEAPGSPILWVVRADGVYRVHGAGAPMRQLGRIEASKGHWSVVSPVWADQGSYRLTDEKTWVVTGRAATGTWKRVWSPADAGGVPSGPGGCRLVTAEEVARALSAPATAGAPDPRAGPNGCVFRSQLSSLDGVTILLRQNQASFFQNVRKGKGASVVDVPGIGNLAFAEVASNGAVTLQVLKGAAWMTIELRLTPDGTNEDVAYVAELGRAAVGRL